MSLKPSSRNRDACGKNFRLCSTRTTHGRDPSDSLMRVEAFMLRVIVLRCAYAKRIFKELRWKTGANPSNPGVELGATGLVFRRGGRFWAGAPLQARSDKRAPSPRACFSRGERAGGEGQLAAGERVTSL